jgi:hypothetical protein
MNPDDQQRKSSQQDESVLVLVKLVIVICSSSYIYLRVARLTHLLSVEELGSIHRLLARLRLSWI